MHTSVYLWCFSVLLAVHGKEYLVQELQTRMVLKKCMIHCGEVTVLANWLFPIFPRQTLVVAISLDLCPVPVSYVKWW